MNNLLIFFAIPVATIIFSIVLQKLLNNPLLVASTLFAIFLLLAFTVFDASFLVLAILYTLLSLVTAVLSRIFCLLVRNNSVISDNNILQGTGICPVETEVSNNGSSGCGCSRGYNSRGGYRRV